VNTERWRRIRNFGRTALAWAIGLSLLVIFPGAAPASADSNVVPDASFRKCLNDAMYGSAGTWAITKQELNDFAGVDVYSDAGYLGVDCWEWAESIRSIEGAQYLTRIAAFELGGSRVTDFSPLAGLAALRELGLWGTKVRLSTLSGLTGLRRLYLSGVGASDVSALSTLTNLTRLDLQSNSITELRPLRSLTRLTELWLGNEYRCPGYEGDCYGARGQHRWTWVGHNAFTDLAPLTSLTNLQRLDLTHTNLSGVSALAGLTSLTSLGLGSNQIRDISPLANLVNLESLYLNGNRITSVSALSRLTNLYEVNLSVNRLANLSALPRLEGWDAGGCDHLDQAPDWGCAETAIAQTADVLVAAPGTYASPVVGRSGLTGTIQVTSSSRSAVVNSSARTVTYAKAGNATLRFTDETWNTGPTFTGTVSVHVLPTVLNISGTAKFGRTLTVPGVPASLTGACQWMRNGTAITGATACSYTVAVADIGASITARLTVANGSSTAYRTTTAVVPVPADYSKVGRPSLSGTVRVGATVTAKPGTWSPKPDSFSYAWYRDGVAINGATASTYTPVAADLATKLTVAVTGTRSGYTTRTRTSKAATVRPGVLTPAKITISGTPQFGTALTANHGTWAPAGVGFGYEWLRGRTVIANAIGSVYTPVAADIGHRLTVRVTGLKPGYTSLTRSATTATVQPLPLTVPARPAITGTPQPGNAVTVSTSGWGPSPVAVACQWYRGGRVIAGATACSYTLSALDTKAVTVRVTGSKEGYRTTVLASASTVRLGSVTSGTVTVSGTAKVGSTLGTATAGWGPAPVAYGYQWLRDGVAITSATGSSYALTGSDRGKRISVRVTGTKSGYTSVTVTSARTARIAA